MVPDSSVGQRHAGRAAARGLEVDRVAVRARLGVAQQLVELRLDPRRQRALEAHRLDVALRPRQPHDRGQQPLEQRVAAEDRVGGGAAGGGQDEAAAGRRLQQPVRRRAGGTSRLAAWVDTPTWRPSSAEVATRPSEPITRRASRYSWAAAEMSELLRCSACRQSTSRGSRLRSRSASRGARHTAWVPQASPTRYAPATANPSRPAPTRASGPPRPTAWPPRAARRRGRRSTRTPRPRQPARRRTAPRRRAAGPRARGPGPAPGSYAANAAHPVSSVSRVATA